MRNVNLKSPRLLVLVAFALAAIALASGYVAIEAQGKGDLVKMFEKEYPKGRAHSPATQRQDEIRAYILNCCKSEEAALQLLEKNGFEIVRKTDPARVAEANKFYRQSKEHWARKSPEYVMEDYDTFISAEMSGRRWENGLYVHAEYSIDLFIKNQQVSWVTARMDLDPFHSIYSDRGEK